MSEATKPGDFGRMVRNIRHQHELRERCDKLQAENERLLELVKELTASAPTQSLYIRCNEELQRAAMMHALRTEGRGA